MKQKQIKIKYWIETIPNKYGFGRDYTLFIQYGRKLRKFWLGQDAKVFSRILGMDMSDAVDYYDKKVGSKDFDKVKEYITEDILHTILDHEWIENGETGIWDKEIEAKEIKKLMGGAEDWSFSVE